MSEEFLSVPLIFLQLAIAMNESTKHKVAREHVVIERLVHTSEQDSEIQLATIYSQFPVKSMTYFAEPSSGLQSASHAGTLRILGQFMQWCNAAPWSKHGQKLQLVHAGKGR